MARYRQQTRAISVPICAVLSGLGTTAGLARSVFQTHLARAGSRARWNGGAIPTYPVIEIPSSRRMATNKQSTGGKLEVLRRLRLCTHFSYDFQAERAWQGTALQAEGEEMR
ncbi:MAG: hypothetical protein IKP81_00405 [Paludibacteraceae bacterium]|nr:hypothetical protein [Paludibacteraceae bacterium]